MIIDVSVPLWISACFLNDNNSFNQKEMVMSLCFVFYVSILSNIELLKTKTSLKILGQEEKNNKIKEIKQFRLKYGLK